MSMTEAFEDILCAAYTTNVDHLSLHTADPGTTGANDSAVTHQALTWTTAANGVSSATVALSALTGTYTHVGLWAGATFRQGIATPISYSATADISILVTHTAGQE